MLAGLHHHIKNVCKQTSFFLLTLSLTFERLKNDNFSLSVNTVSIGVGNIPPEGNSNEKRIKSLPSPRV